MTPAPASALQPDDNATRNFFFPIIFPTGYFSLRFEIDLATNTAFTSTPVSRLSNIVVFV